MARSIRRLAILSVSITTLTALTPAGALAADTTKPTVVVTAPTAGSTVSGTVTMTASALDDVGVTQVKWFIDGKEVGWDGAAPWSDTWSAGSVAAGSHSIYARAADAANNWGQSATLSFTTAATSSGGTTGSWTLVQQDDFNGTAVDTTKWAVYGPWIKGNAGYGIRSSSAVTVANGLMTITAQMQNGTLVSGGMSNKLNQMYGKFEFRVRTDADPSLATSGVVLTWPQSGNWPIDGENDIYETTLDADRNPIKSYIHYSANNQQLWFHHAIDGTQWHVFAMEWAPTYIKIYRDGALVWTVTDTAVIPDVAHHMSIQLDAFKNSMTGTVRMQVDWVKIYKRG